MRAKQIRTREQRQREYQKNRTHIRRQQAEGSGASPEVFLRRLSKIAKRNAAIPENYLIALWYAQEGRCYWSGLPMTHQRGRGRVPTNASVDRVDPRKGYIPGNMVLCCWKINMMKSNSSPEMFLALCRAVVAQEQVCLSTLMSA